MAGLDNIPQTQSIEIATVKLDEDVFKSITNLQQDINFFLNDFGQIYVRKKELNEELLKLDEVLEKTEDEFKATNIKLREIFDSLDEIYPQGRINMSDGTIQYQPGAPSRKQMAEQQAQSDASMKVVKE